MKKFKKIISIACLIMFSTLLFAGCEDSNIIKLKRDFETLTFENYYGYMQTVEVQAGVLSYTSYEKIIGYDGHNYKVYEMEKALNGLDASEQFTVTDNMYYIINGKKYELVDGKYQETVEAEIDLSLGITIKGEYFKGFSVQEDENGIKIFYGVLLTSKANEFLNKEIQDLKQMTLKVIVRSGKLSTCSIKYTKIDDSMVEISTVFYTEAQDVSLPQ